MIDIDEIERVLASGKDARKVVAEHYAVVKRRSRWTSWGRRRRAAKLDKLRDTHFKLRMCERQLLDAIVELAYPPK